MQLPGLITIRPEQTDLIERAARVMGESFMEEQWFATWLSALDELGTSDERKKQILVASFIDEFNAHTPYQAVYATEDFAAVAGGYLASELRGKTHMQLEEEENGNVARLLTPEEAALLEAQAKKMEAISNFSWAADAAEQKEHIYFYAWAVDANARGTGAFRRLITPFFNYADEHGLNVYLECYSDKLQSLYEHVGFEMLFYLRDPAFDVVERCMVRKPQR